MVPACLFDCAPGNLTTVPDVLIDDRFTREEQLSLYDGMNEWQSRIPIVKYNPMVASHAEVLHYAQTTGRPNTIYMLRVRDSLDTECPTSLVGALAKVQFFVGLDRDRVYYPGSYICFAANPINMLRSVVPHVWRRVATHELGHSWAIFHAEPGVDSVMTPMIEKTAEHVTCHDLLQFASMWAIKLSCA